MKTLISIFYSGLLLFGVFFSAAFAGLKPTKKDLWIFAVLSFVCGVLQIIFYSFGSEDTLRKIYPLIVHMPLFLYYKKRFSTALLSITTTYLCCQPDNFFGLIAFRFTHSPSLEYAVRIVALVLTAFILLRFAFLYLAQIYNKVQLNLYILGILPVGYYLYDYSFGLSTDLQQLLPIMTEEILPLLLVFIYVLFCIAYYDEYEMRQTAEQQKKELDAMKRSAHEIRLIRHDMRHLLDNISFCLDVNDTEKAKELIAGFITHIDATIVARYCKNDTLNYVLSSYVAKCEQYQVHLTLDVQIDEIAIDEIILSSLLTNVFENALNAQLELPKEKRKIKILITKSNERILISVKNPFHKKPVFADGLPVLRRKGHGYGTQSIRYLTEKIGGNYQFSVQDDQFVVRLIL